VGVLLIGFHAVARLLQAKLFNRTAWADPGEGVPFFVEGCNFQTKIFPRKGTRSLHKNKIFLRNPEKAPKIFPRKTLLFCN
jgi:hypothetical protein